MQAWFVYMIRCNDMTLYTGVTTDVLRRFKEHKEGGRKGSKYVRARIPLAVVYTKMCVSRSDAQKQEHVLKKLTRKEKEALILQNTKK